MSTVRELHNRAMELAQRALVERETGNHPEATGLAGEALSFELEAATLLQKSPAAEPTRSIIYQSAASLAQQAGDLPQAQRLIAEALSGYPPPRVEQELKHFFEEINFDSHLAVHGRPLASSEVQLAIVGDDVGYGRAVYSVFEDRFSALKGLLDRTSRLLAAFPFQRTPTSTSGLFTTIITAPRPGSFAVTAELRPRGQQQPLMVSGEQVIERVIDGVRAVQDQDLERLERRIQDDSYFRNFVTLAQQLAPDGERVRMVGLTSAKGEVSLTKPKAAIEIPEARLQPLAPRDVLATFQTVTGLLDEASLRGERIGFTTMDDRQINIRVQEGMDDIVRSYFNRLVEVRLRVEGKERELVSLTPVED